MLIEKFESKRSDRIRIRLFEKYGSETSFNMDPDTIKTPDLVPTKTLGSGCDKKPRIHKPALHWLERIYYLCSRNAQTRPSK